MLFSAFTPLASAVESSSASAMGRIFGSARGRMDTTSRLVLSKKRSKSFAPTTRRDEGPSSSNTCTSSLNSRLSPVCSTRSMTRTADLSATSCSSGSRSMSLATLIITGSTSDRWRWTVCPSGTMASDARPWICRLVHSSLSAESSRSTMGNTAPGCFATSCSRPWRKSAPCSSTSSSDSCCSTHVTTSVVAREPTALCSRATTSLAELRTLSLSSMMACRMAGMRSPR
mmetsp:Transcript_68412/g.176396  ORF Transcript_68412/g.176396 Transcript_68412/m.176396 type:complete len:229 (+) Transcript_68412:968-1654(+)